MVETRELLIYLVFLVCLLGESIAKPIVSPFFKPKPGQGYEVEHPIQDKYYHRFYSQGKKNNIAKLPKNITRHKLRLTREALLKATSAQTTALVAAAQAARSSLEIAKLARKAEAIAVKRANWALETVRVAAKAEEVAVTAIETLFM